MKIWDQKHKNRNLKTKRNEDKYVLSLEENKEEEEEEEKKEMTTFDKPCQFNFEIFYNTLDKQEKTNPNRSQFIRPC
jgi:hypothetical protein